MCGIAGIVGGAVEKREAVQCMVKAMHHRGPDDSGVYADEAVAIGMARLAILDLSPLGHQPMQSHCKRYWIVYNGECYNFPEIRKKLEDLGDRFISHSDTEVVLQAYIRWGASCLQYMNGMFAFAIWDTVAGELFAARDHLGIKPFYYQFGQNRFVFGSELKALLQSGHVTFEVDADAACQYFWFGHVVQPRTILKNVFALMPGHYLTVRDDKLQVSSYWNIDQVQTCYRKIEEVRDDLMVHLDRTVKMQLISDRPIGLFLSGGLDSATILACMARAGSNINSFSLGFAENSFAKSEEREAKELAYYFGACHEQITIEGKDVATDIEHFFDSLEQPTVDGLNTYLVSKYAVNSMTVALSGLGGDELFGGYTGQALLWWKYNRGISLPSGLFPEFMNSNENLIRMQAQLRGKDILFNYTVSRSGGAINAPKQFLRSTFLSSSLQHDFFSSYEHLHLNQTASPFSKILGLDLKGFMGSQLLRDMDVLSMAHSLEVRFPLIDYQLVEFAYSLPDNIRAGASQHRPVKEGVLDYDSGKVKRLLLETMLPHLPKDFNKRRKSGFKLPIGLWLQHDLKDFALQLLQDELNEGTYLNPQIIGDQMKRLRLEENNNWQSWKIVAFLGALKGLKRNYNN